MRLKADAVDRHALGLEVAHDRVQAVGLRVDAVGADLVEVELRVGSAARAVRNASSMKPGPSRRMKTDRRSRPLSAIGSLTTSQTPTSRSQRPTTARMCSRVAWRSSLGPSSRTQPGSCACQTSVCPRTFCPASSARLTMSSAAPNSNFPRSGSTALPLHLVLRRHRRELRGDELAVGADALEHVAAHGGPDLDPALPCASCSSGLPGSGLASLAAADDPDPPTTATSATSTPTAAFRSCQNAPRRVKTAGTVFTRIARSRNTDQRSRYRKSRRTRSSKSSSERPETCHRPVMPGVTR